LPSRFSCSLRSAFSRFLQQPEQATAIQVAAMAQHGGAIRWQHSRIASRTASTVTYATCAPAEPLTCARSPPSSSPPPAHAAAPLPPPGRTKHAHSKAALFNWLGTETTCASLCQPALLHSTRRRLAADAHLAHESASAGRIKRSQPKPSQ
jgi:uncharacterized membrane protein